ncbi:energy transducer TonB [Niabella ginsenosidivorans]|uniref:Energy transducer TonB n=1 Tax=Niabella ginsenosidivorans TaxID=1176587 RepID=A0A1A9HWC1_9BACT|nr:energy transducer TonB [Niabella ginsenosidivorans]ANH79708.1 energy transducer TonB [Niabella ginsenosidivorans]
METKQILSSSLLDIVFDGKNKAYGAYELRTTYSRRLLKALLATGILIGIVVSVALLKPEPEKTAVPVIGPDVTIIEKIDEPQKTEPPVPVPPKQSEPKKIETQKFVIPRITPDKLMTDPPPAQKDLTDVRIGIENIKGDKTGNIAVPPIGDVDGGRGIVETKTKDKEPDIATFVQVEAKYPGDWIRFLTTNLRGDTPVDNGAAPGNYQVLVQFVVDVDGTVSDMKVLKDPGYGMSEEAIRVIQKSGKWKPAIQNGYPVKAYRKQPITFQVVEQ